MGATVTPAPLGPAHEESSSAFFERFTKGGRNLFYKLTVIQQPERARACGSGQKSSADRRPVDPPPVVELRIFEGRTWEEAQQRDITFQYNANFFLFATLENARVMAHGRIQTPAANQTPVLTGMPVSGMAYLDRPVEAGYFLFPDLSVRHEGRYRLVFNLYEDTKEDRDKDAEPMETKPAQPGLPTTNGSFDFRMEIKSADFTVFSAKKFPGLKSSTPLSQLVADQGCRVRIRRDVRMRRREKKDGDYDNVQDEYARRGRTETPEAKDFRSRSMSGSVERTPYSADLPRRPSGAEYPSEYPPSFPSQVASAGGHLQFLGPMSNPQYPPQPPSIPQSPSYQASQASPTYPHQGGYMAPSQPPYGHMEQAAPQPYTLANPAPQREPAPYTRPSEESVRRQSAPMRPLHSEYADFNPIAPAVPTPKVTLPPINIPKTPTPSTTPTVPTPSRMMPPLISPNGKAFPNMLHNSGNAPSGPSLTTTPVTGTKRTRDESFNYENEPSRYHNGAREDPSVANEEEPMEYSRADGRRMVVENFLG